MPGAFSDDLGEPTEFDLCVGGDAFKSESSPLTIVIHKASMRSLNPLHIVPLLFLFTLSAEAEWTLRGGLLYESPGDFSGASEALSSTGVDSGIGFTVAAGYDLLAFRVEAELMRLKTDLGGYSGSLGNVTGDYQRTAVFGNVSIDFPLFPLVDGYIGAGVGMAKVSLEFDGEVAGQAVDGIRFSDDATIFGAQAMAGIRVELADRVSAQVGYRYLYFSESVVHASDLSLSSDAGEHAFEISVGIGY